MVKGHASAVSVAPRHGIATHGKAASPRGDSRAADARISVSLVPQQGSDREGAGVSTRGDNRVANGRVSLSATPQQQQGADRQSKGATPRGDSRVAGITPGCAPPMHTSVYDAPQMEISHRQPGETLWSQRVLNLVSNFTAPPCGSTPIDAKAHSLPPLAACSHGGIGLQESVMETAPNRDGHGSMHRCKRNGEVGSDSIGTLGDQQVTQDAPLHAIMLSQSKNDCVAQEGESLRGRQSTEFFIPSSATSQQLNN